MDAHEFDRFLTTCKRLQDHNRLLARALNIAMRELRDLSESNRFNSFDDVMTRLSPDVRDYLAVDPAPVYWESNDYDPEL